MLRHSSSRVPHQDHQSKMDQKGSSKEMHHQRRKSRLDRNMLRETPGHKSEPMNHSKQDCWEKSQALLRFYKRNENSEVYVQCNWRAKKTQ